MSSTAVATPTTSDVRSEPQEFEYTRDDLVEAITTEVISTGRLHCTPTDAELVIDLLKRTWHEGCHMLNSTEMEVVHPFLDVIMIDGNTTPNEGSAHAIANQLLLPEGHAYLHDKDTDGRCFTAIEVIETT